MAPKLYVAPLGAPSRVALITAKCIGMEVEIKPLDMFKKAEHKTPAYRKINPQHSAPFLEDNGFCLAESRAISKYLVNTYAPEKSLYPEDNKTRALIDARLDFDGMTLSVAFAKVYTDPLFRGYKTSDRDLASLREALSILDQLIGQTNSHVVGNELTLADIVIATTLSNFEVVNYDLSAFKNVSRVYENAKATIPGFDIYNTGIFDKMRALVGIN